MRRLTGLVGFLVVFGALGAAFGSSVRAGHTMPLNTGGDCWRVGTPLWCRASWYSAPDHIVFLRVIDQIGGNLSSPIATACNNWHNFSAPPAGQSDIACHTSSFPNDTWDYIKNVGQMSGIFALTWNCNTSSVCSASSAQSMNVWYSEVRADAAQIGGLNAAQRLYVFAHELGHTLGLAHHSGLLMTPGAIPNPPPGGPTTLDYGALPPCWGSYSGWGVRCIFNLPS